MASSAHFIDAADAVAAEDAKTAAAATAAGRAARPHDASTRPSFVPSSPSFEAEVAAAAASQHFVRAATKIQASFRGHKARVEVAEKHGHRHHHHGIPANHFPHAGPLQSEGGPPPPRRRRRNPVFVATTSGGNSSFGCPGSGHTAHTIHFDQSHSLPSALEGVYSQTQWVAINGELDSILRDTYLPLCPAGVMCIIPIAGALSFMCWRARLQEERLQRLETRIDTENTRLQQWGLRWILIPVNERTRHGRSDEISGFVLQLLMGPAATSAAGLPCRAIATTPGEQHLSMQPATAAAAASSSTAARPAAPAPAPAAQTMNDRDSGAGDAKQSQQTSSGGVVIQVRAVGAS